MHITLSTSNMSKAKEIQDIIQEDFRVKNLSLKEIQSINVDDVIRFKAEQAYEQVGSWVLVEDTSLAFAAWHGLPGALIKWFIDTVDCGGICQMLKEERNRQAIAKCTFDLYDGKEHHLFSGSVRGTVADEPRGREGFGWDPIFIPEGYKQTFAEMSAQEKNSFSMRKLALDQLQDFLLLVRSQTSPSTPL